MPNPNQLQHGERIVAIGWGDLNPLKWLGKGAAAVGADAWKAAMTAIWSAGLWVLGLAFKIIDAFTTPDLSTNGPLAEVLPITFGIGAGIAVLMALVQVGLAAFRRDGQSLARVLIGVVQFWGVWIGYTGLAAVLVVATAGLTRGLLQGLLHVDAFSGFSNSASWPRNVDDTVVATVLGFATIFLIFPAAIGYVLIMLVREAALMLLTATAPISAAGLLSEGTRAWFWKTLRWFFASLMIAPLAALVLGIGVKITQGTVDGHGDKTAAAVGMAVVGCVLILIGAICPLILFRLLAFVDPGTSSGAAMRQSLAANGGMARLLSGGKSGSGAETGSGAASQQDGQGRSQGEASADSATQSRFAGLLGGMGSVGNIAGLGAKAMSSVASQTTAIGADVLGAAGVGHQAPYFGQGDISGDSGRGQTPNGSGSSGSGSSGGGAGGGSSPGGGADGGSATPLPPTPPMPPMPPTPPMPGGPGGGGAAGGGAAGGEAAGGAAGVAAEVPIVPV